MNKNGYLNEEQYKKSNKKVKVVGSIMIIIGVILLVISFFVIKVPPMGDENWFELSQKSALFRFGGFAFTAFGCMVRFVIGNRREIMAYQAQQGMPIAQESLKKMAPSMGKAAKEIIQGMNEGYSSDETIYCKHCGASIDADSSFCKVCGKQV